MYSHPQGETVPITGLGMHVMSTRDLLKLPGV